MKPVLPTGFESDDWTAIIYVKTHPFNFFGQIFNLWSKVGTHHAGQYIYINTLFDILGFNYPSFIKVNIFLKILSAISIFPAVLLVFRSRTLAFLATIINSISYSSTGALTYILQGVFYLGITFMNIFFVFYYWAVKRDSKFCLFLASLSLMVSYFLAAGRIFPVFVLILLIEGYLLIKNGFKFHIKSLIRLTIFFTPILILILLGRKDYPYSSAPIYQYIMNGDLVLLMYPFSGLGQLFLPGEKSAFIAGIFISIFTVFCLLRLKKTKNEYKQLLLAVIFGSTVSFLFLLGIWFVVGKALFLYGAYGGINRYFVFPALGSSLFTGAVLTIILKKTARKNILVFGHACVFFSLVFLFYISSKEISSGFGQINSNNLFLLRNAYLHQSFQESFISQLQVEKLMNSDAVLFYFELKDDEKDFYKKAVDFYDMHRWLYLRLGFTQKKCIEVIYDQAVFNKAIKPRGGIQKLVPVDQHCIMQYTAENLASGNEANATYNVQKNFYAFRIQNDHFINITADVIKRLNLE